MYIDIILFAILAAVLATNLYKILGKKTISEDANVVEKNIKIEEDNNIISNDVMDYSQKQIFDLDKDFSFSTFIDGSKSAFNLIVSAYKNKKIQEVKELLSLEVYENFKKSISKDTSKEEEISSFQIVTLKAEILNIEVIKKLARIKVEFSSTQESILEKGNKNNIEAKDIWVFEREMDSVSLVWKLIEVRVK